MKAHCASSIHLHSPPAPVADEVRGALDLAPGDLKEWAGDDLPPGAPIDYSEVETWPIVFVPNDPLWYDDDAGTRASGKTT